MPKESNDLLRLLKKVDGYSRVISGKSLAQLIANTIEVFGDDVIEKPRVQQKVDPLMAQYMALGADPDWSIPVIKSLYRAQARECHPDGAKPDEAKFKKLTAAYEAIMASRKTK